MRAALVLTTNVCIARGSVRISCGSGSSCQQQTETVGSTCSVAVITICMPPSCTKIDQLMLKWQLIHELTHARQVCNQGCRFYSDCAHAVCAEIEAYCREDPINCTPAKKCGLACSSADVMCPNPVTCQRLCTMLFASCADDGDPLTPPPLPPADPILPPDDSIVITSE